MKSEFTIDLHMHTSISDGNMTPCQVIDAAAEAGLKKIVMTDHNSFHNNFDLICGYAKSQGIEIPLAGAELSAKFIDWQKPPVKFHLLVYGLPESLKSDEFQTTVGNVYSKANKIFVSDVRKVIDSGDVNLTEEKMFILDSGIAPTEKIMKFGEDYLVKAVAKDLNISYEEAEIKTASILGIKKETETIQGIRRISILNRL